MEGTPDRGQQLHILRRILERFKVLLNGGENLIGFFKEDPQKLGIYFFCTGL